MADLDDLNLFMAGDDVGFQDDKGEFDILLSEIEVAASQSNLFTEAQGQTAHFSCSDEDLMGTFFSVELPQRSLHKDCDLNELSESSDAPQCQSGSPSSPISNVRTDHSTSSDARQPIETELEVDYFFIGHSADEARDRQENASLEKSRQWIVRRGLSLISSSSSRRARLIRAALILYCIVVPASITALTHFQRESEDVARTVPAKEDSPTDSKIEIAGETSTLIPLVSETIAPSLTTPEKLVPTASEESASNELPIESIDLNKVSILSATLDEVAKDPERYLNRLILPDELLWISSRIERGPGAYERLIVDRTIPANKKSPRSESPIPVVATREVADNIRKTFSSLLPNSNDYPAIADLRIVKDSSGSDSYLAVVERVEFIRQWSSREIFQRHWTKAFQVALATSSEAKLTLGRGEEWRKRFDAPFLNTVRNEYKRSVSQSSEAIFSRAMQLSAKEAEAANQLLQQQQAEMRRRSFGINTFPR